MTSAAMNRVPAANAWGALAGWLLVSAAAGAIGAWASLDAQAFYAQLAKPSWAPPASVFGPVWTVLYALMGVAAWLVWRERAAPGRQAALGVFVAQLALNALWSWLFFAWHRGALAFGDVVLLLALVAVTTFMFWRVRTLAGLLMLPYLAWVAFATALCFRVWQDNPALLG
jgi:tryptophan-rich sensory protein